MTTNEPATGKLIVVIDDDVLVLDAMRGILRRWGCSVVSADTGAAALERLAEINRKPDLIIADYRLAGGKTGVEAIETLRDAVGSAVPALLISGDSSRETPRGSTPGGYPLLRKPVLVTTLRATVNSLLK